METQQEESNKSSENRYTDPVTGKFIPGNPGGGRPKGQTLKEYWRERFKQMTDEEKLEFTNKVGNESIWRMAEGNPHNTNDLTTKGKPLPIYGGISIQGHDSDKEDIQTEEEDQGG